MAEEAGTQVEPEVEPTELNTNTDMKEGDYHNRLRSEPEFAVSENQNKNRYISELNEQLKTFKPLAQYVGAVGGDEIVRLAGVASQMETNPELRQLVSDFHKGIKPAAPVVETELETEIFDPDLKLVRDESNTRSAEQDTVIRGLSERLQVAEANGLKVSLTENMDSALAMYADDAELLGEAKDEIKRTVAGLEQASTNGDREAFVKLQQIAGPEGATTLRMMTIAISDKYHAKKLEAATNNQTPNGADMLSSKATDSRNSTRAALPNNAIAIPSGAKVTTELVTSVMEQVARRLGKDPHELFR